jgi:hypothetical protein
MAMVAEVVKGWLDPRKKRVESSSILEQYPNTVSTY